MMRMCPTTKKMEERPTPLWRNLMSLLMRQSTMHLRMGELPTPQWKRLTSLLMMWGVLTRNMKRAELTKPLRKTLLILLQTGLLRRNMMSGKITSLKTQPTNLLMILTPAGGDTRSVAEVNATLDEERHGSLKTYVDKSSIERERQPTHHMSGLQHQDRTWWRITGPERRGR
jgi:hypothetical protein